jgi:hypothetical protein
MTRLRPTLLPVSDVQEEPGQTGAFPGSILKSLPTIPTMKHLIEDLQELPYIYIPLL